MRCEATVTLADGQVLQCNEWDEHEKHRHRIASTVDIVWTDQRMTTSAVYGERSDE